MSNHTPGPWTFNYYSPTEEYFIDFEGGCAKVIGDNVESEARLIAAAPELLEALRAMLAASLPVDKGANGMDAVEKAISAINKARGMPDKTDKT